MKLSVAELAALELEHRKRTGENKRLSFVDFVNRVKPEYVWYDHCKRLAAVLQDVADGKRKRLMIYMPPRHGKSELASKLFPAYYLYRNPDKWVGVASHSQTLADTFSRAAKANFVQAGGKLSKYSFAASHWEITSNSGMWASGWNAPATGKGFDLGIIDDVVADKASARSKAVQRSIREWYNTVFYTRRAPGAAIILIMTRWHLNDLAGYLLDLESQVPEGWHVVHMEAVKEDEKPAYPATCTVESDPRKPGEALCPERYPINELERLRAMDAEDFSALYQQRPVPSEGNIFKQAWLRFWVPRGIQIGNYVVPTADGDLIQCAQVEIPEKMESMLQSWDLTFKDTAGSDYVVGQVWTALGADRFLLDQTRNRLSFTDTVRAVESLTDKYPDAKVKLIEDKANGPAVINTLKKNISGLIPVNPNGSKTERASAITYQFESGNVYLPHPDIFPWVKDLITEMCSFPNAPHDDQVDALTQALQRMENSGKKQTAAHW